MFVFLNGEWVWAPRGLCSIEGGGDNDGDESGTGSGGGDTGGDGAGGDQDHDTGGGGGGDVGDGADAAADGAEKGKVGKSGAGLHATAKGAGGAGDGNSDAETQDGSQDADTSQADGAKGSAITLHADGKLSIKEAPAWFPKDHVNDDGTLDLKGAMDRLHGLREKISVGGDKAPKEASEYKFELPDSVKERQDDIFPAGMDKDPLLNWFRGKAHELGYSPDQFQDTVASFVEERAKLLPEPLDGAKELEKLGPNGAATYAFFGDYFNRMFDEGTLNEEDMIEAEVMTMTASGIRFLSKIFEAQGENLGEKRLAHVAATTKGAMTPAELEAAQTKWNIELDKGNPAAEGELRKLEKKFEETFGTDPAGTSAIAS